MTNSSISQKELNKIDLNRHKHEDPELIGKLVCEVRRLKEVIDAGTFSSETDDELKEKYLKIGQANQDTGWNNALDKLIEKVESEMDMDYLIPIIDSIRIKPEQKELPENRGCTTSNQPLTDTGSP